MNANWWRDRHNAWQIGVMEGRIFVGFLRWVNEGRERYVRPPEDVLFGRLPPKLRNPES